MTDLLLSPPWWLYGSVFIIGLIVWVSGNKRDDARRRWVGIGIIGLGALMAALSFLVETDSQKVTRQSKELVQSVVDQNWDRFQALLKPDVTLSDGDSPLYRSRERVLADAKLGIRFYGLHGASASVEEVDKEPSSIKTTVRVYSTGDQDPGHPVPSLWRFDWEKSSDGHWAVRDIRALEIANFKGPELDGVLRRAP